MSDSHRVTFHRLSTCLRSPDLWEFMGDHPAKDIRELITRLTHPAAVNRTSGSTQTDHHQRHHHQHHQHQHQHQHQQHLVDVVHRFDNASYAHGSDDDNGVLYELEEIRDTCTQTSKTILQLARIEAGQMTPDSLSTSPRSDHQYEDEDDDQDEDPVIDGLSSRDFIGPKKTEVEPLQLNLTESESSRSPSLIETFLRRNKSKYLPKKSLKSRSCVETYRPLDLDSSHPQHSRFTVRNSTDTEKSFMLPTLASEQKNLLPEVREMQTLFSPIRRGRSSSPKPKRQIARPRIKIPYIDQSESDISTKHGKKGVNLVSRLSVAERRAQTQIETPSPPNCFSKDMLRIDEMSLVLVPTENNSAIYLSDPNSSTEANISGALTRLQDSEWNVALKGLAEVIELCKAYDECLMLPHMTTVNQRLIQLLKSPRSHVCRTACQAAGHLFELMKYTKGPEFDDVVDLLLAKTADANKFIRKDANLALDCMVTHVATAHAVRALCAKGPRHKNSLVRSATVRLLICAVVIAGPATVLGPGCGEATRRRIFANLVQFIEDKHPETRKYGERLYKVLSKERLFNGYVKKYVERDDLTRMKKILKVISKK